MKYILRDAMRSLRNSGKNAVYYWMTFYLSSFLLFLYFNIAESARADSLEIYADAPGNTTFLMYLENGNVGVIIMLLLVGISAADILSANSCFVKYRHEEMAVRLISGSTYTQLALFLLAQTTVLLVSAVPAGIVSAVLAVPACNYALRKTGLRVGLHQSSVTEFAVLFLFLLAWTVLLNIGTVFQCSAADLLEGKGNREKKPVLSSFLKAYEQTIGWLACFLYLVPVYMFYKGSTGIVFYTLTGCLCMIAVIRTVIIPLITRYNRRHIRNAEREAAAGFLRADLKVSGSSLFFLIFDLSLLLFFMARRDSGSAEHFLLLLTFAVTAFLQTMTLLFRLETALVERKEAFMILTETGFSRAREKSVCRKEIAWLFLIVFCAVFLYLGNILCSLMVNGEIGLDMAVFLSVTVSVLLVLSTVFSYRYYWKAVCGI